MAWRMLSASRKGPRKRNEDFVLYRWYYPDGRRRYSLILACDGVGGRPHGAECARGIGWAVARALPGFLSKRLLPQPFQIDDENNLYNMLRQLPVQPFHMPGGQSTMVLILYAHHQKEGSDSILVAWSGDSRAQVLTADYELRILTKDHVGVEDQLTAFYDSDGLARGHLDVLRLTFDRSPIALCVTTDGIHKKCRDEDWRKFLAYCLIDDVADNRHFKDLLERFLNTHASDNFSASLLFRPGVCSELDLESILKGQ